MFHHTLELADGPLAPILLPVDGPVHKRLGDHAEPLKVATYGDELLASSVYANDSYSKPFFVTYFSTILFTLPLIPLLLLHSFRDGLRRISSAVHLKRTTDKDRYAPLSSDQYRDPLLRRSQDDEEEPESIANDAEALRRRLPSDDPNDPPDVRVRNEDPGDVLSVLETAKLGLEFCVIWFTVCPTLVVCFGSHLIPRPPQANYFSALCLEYTTVASSTILTSTSSVWTLLFGSIVRIERFTFRKLLAVICVLFGIFLISTTDLSSPDNDGNRGTFPHKSASQIALGDSLALLSAVLYGAYAVWVKKRIGHESRIRMPLFFGLVGLFNGLFLWPAFFILNSTGLEQLELPPTRRIWQIVLINGVFSLLSDFAWAYATLLISPLVVTVGLSLTIPISLIGQMILYNQRSSLIYWIGAVVVFLGFAFVERLSDGGNQDRSEENSQEPVEIEAD